MYTEGPAAWRHLERRPHPQLPHTTLAVQDGLLDHKGPSIYPDYLEGQGDLVSRLKTPIAHIVALIIPIISLLTKSP